MKISKKEQKQKTNSLRYYKVACLSHTVGQNNKKSVYESLYIKISYIEVKVIRINSCCFHLFSAFNKCL